MKKERIYLSLFIIIHLFITGIFCFQKENYFIDEFMTYSLANSKCLPQIVQEESKYTDYGPYQEYLTVDQNNRFNYKNVWLQQKLDVHPPIYYTLIHTVCSFFPEQFSKWYGLSVNLFCLILIDIILFNLLKKIFHDSTFIPYVILAGYGTSIIFMNMMVFIRMYALLTLFVISLIYLFYTYYNLEKPKKYWILQYLIVLGGTLTQYYFLIFLFWISLFIGIDLIKQKKYREGVLFVVDLGLSGLSAIIIFPAMLEHIFMGYRGKEAVSNVFSFSEIFVRIKSYIAIINKEVFGGLFWVALALFIIELIRNRKKIWNIEYFTIFSAILYVLVILKISPTLVDRYIMPVCWILYCFFLIAIFKYLCEFVKNKNKTMTTFVAISIVTCLNVFNLYQFGWTVPETYKNNNEMMYYSLEHSDHDAIIISNTTESDWRTLYNVMDLKNYNSYYVTTPEKIQTILEKDSNLQKNIILYLCADADKDEIYQILESNVKSIESFDYVGLRGTTTIYSVRLEIN